MIEALVTQLRQVLQPKKDIQVAARYLGEGVGDDCAAIADGDGYLLLAAEGLLPQFLASDPWFAGWSAVMVNVSDIYAMGGTPIAVVDVIWSEPDRDPEPIWAGMQAAAACYGVPIVGGHSNHHSSYTALAVAIMGRAKTLISSFTAQPGDTLMLLADGQGAMHPTYAFWDAATTAAPQALRAKLALLPRLAEDGICTAGKDISMGGLVGTAVMLLETSGCGAEIWLDRVPCPEGVDLHAWLTCFPSYGFLLATRSPTTLQRYCAGHGLICAPIGTITAATEVILHHDRDRVCFWDTATQPLTGF